MLSLQNGVHKDEMLRSHLPDEQILGGVCFISAFIEEPGVITHNSTLQKIVLGPYHHSQRPISHTVLSACLDAGIDTELSDDILNLIE